MTSDACNSLTTANTQLSTTTMPHPMIFVTTVIAFIAAGCSLLAQERRVSFDTSGTVMTIDLELEKRLGLFPDIEGFQEAVLYLGIDSSYSLEIFHQLNGQTERIRRMMSAMEGRVFQRKVTDLIATQSPKDMLDQSGRTSLLVGTTGLGLSFYGIAVPMAADVDDTRSAVGLYMLTAASSFFVPFFLTRSGTVTEPQAGMTIYGGFKGIADGMFLYGLVTGSDGFDEAPGPLWSGVGGGIIEAVIGFNVARRMDGAHVRLLASGGTMGNLLGLGGGYLIDFDDFRGYAALMLAGTAGGYIASNALYHTGHYTEGDAQIFSTTTTFGAGIPIGLLYMVGIENDNTLVAAGMLGAVAGGWLGHRIALGHNYTNPQGSLTGIGTISMGLLGAGIGYLVSPDNDDDITTRRVAGGAALGAIGGFGLMYALVGSDAGHKDHGANLRLDISPAGVASLVTGSSAIPTGWSVPLVSLCGAW